MMILALSWWILVAPKDSEIADLKQPYMMGPYPSAELCRLAALAAMPDELRFKTPAQITAKEATFAAAPRNKAGWAYIGNEGRHYDSNGNVDGGSVSLEFWRASSYNPPIALTGCTSLQTGE